LYGANSKKNTPEVAMKDILGALLAKVGQLSSFFAMPSSSPDCVMPKQESLRGWTTILMRGKLKKLCSPTGEHSHN
jgi:hypothetical protein